MTMTTIDQYIPRTSTPATAANWTTYRAALVIRLTRAMTADAALDIARGMTEAERVALIDTPFEPSHDAITFMRRFG
jgi:hypothetical protein